MSTIALYQPRCILHSTHALGCWGGAVESHTWSLHLVERLAACPNLIRPTIKKPLLAWWRRAV
jgi:hypothetical protein